MLCFSFYTSMYVCRERDSVALAFALKPQEVSPLICTAYSKPGKYTFNMSVMDHYKAQFLLCTNFLWNISFIIIICYTINVLVSCTVALLCLLMFPCCVCFRAYVDATMMKKRRQKVFEKLGGFSQQGAVCTILGKDMHSELVSQDLHIVYLYFLLCQRPFRGPGKRCRRPERVFLEISSTPPPNSRLNPLHRCERRWRTVNLSTCQVHRAAKCLTPAM